MRTQRPSYGANRRPRLGLSDASRKKLLKVDARSENGFEGQSSPQKSEKFLGNFFEFSQNHELWSAKVILDHLT